MTGENESPYVEIPADADPLSTPHQPGSVVPRQGGIAPITSDISALSAAECRQQYRELLSPSKVAAMNGFERKNAIAQGEALMKRAADLDSGAVKAAPAVQQPAAAQPSAQAPAAPPGPDKAARYAAAKTDKERAAIMAEPERSPEEIAAAAALAANASAESDFGPAGQSPQAYENLFRAPGMSPKGQALATEMSAILHENGVPLAVAKAVHGTAMGAFLKASNEGRADMCERACVAIEGAPGGEAIVAAAERYFANVPDGNWKRACLIAATHPAGIRWMAARQMQAAR